MLELTFSGAEYFDEETNSFIVVEPRTIKLEHSLISLSKWEAIHHKPFLVETPEKTEDELISYIKCMTITPNVPDEVYMGLTEDMLKKIKTYLEDPMSATTINDRRMAGSSRSNEILTSEVIYYIMIANNIPIEFQKWHLNRLLTLIKVCGIKNQDPKANKMSQQESMEYQRAMQMQRRKAKGMIK